MSELRIRDEALAHAATLPVFGVPVRLRSDTPAIVAAFEESFAGWRVLEGRPDLVAGAGVEGRIVLHAGDECGHARPAVRHRFLPPGRLLYSTPGSVCLSDAPRREFTGWVTRDLVEERAHFRANLLESAVFWVVTRLDRQPLHAAAVVRDGAALLLTGPSGTGKSTLAYAAARAGLAVLTDEVVFAQLHPLRVWGMPRTLHLPADAARHFPELAGADVRRMPNGKDKIVVDLAPMGAAAPFPMVERVGVCVLDRTGARAGAAEPLAPAQVEAAMLGTVEEGFDLFRDTVGEPIRALAAGGAWRLGTGGDPDEAARALPGLLDAVTAGGGPAGGG